MTGQSRWKENTEEHVFFDPLLVMSQDKIKPKPSCLGPKALFWKPYTVFSLRCGQKMKTSALPAASSGAPGTFK